MVATTGDAGTATLHCCIGIAAQSAAEHFDGAVTGVTIETLQPNSYGARALPQPMHSTSGACNE